MYLLYLDDSGSIKNKDEEHFVLGGICVHEDKGLFINQRMDQLAETISPGTPNGVEFHASEIRRGKTPPWDQMQFLKRGKVIKDVLDVVNQEDRKSCLFACAVHKPSFPGQDPMKIAFEDLFSRFDMFLSRIYHQIKESHRGLIIFDESAHEKTLQSLATDFRQIGTKWSQTRNIQEVPLFVDSKASRLIQIADHVAYAVFRRYESADLNYFNVIQDRFDSDNGKLHGLAHKQTSICQCTCPPCFAKKMQPH